MSSNFLHEEPEPEENPEAAADPSSRATLRLGHLLGSGRHGLVFIGEFSNPDGDGRSVAVKVPNTPGGLDHERANLRRFAHPSVIEVIDGPMANGALVLEYCDLGTLADRVANGPLSLDDVAELIEALSPPLVAIHESGWIHGDISPGNIGLRSGAGPVLLDFATARPADGSSIDEGTAEFAGPLRQADPRLDVRAFAATLLRSLGTPDRWDHHKRQHQDRLRAVISRCDSGAAVHLSEVQEIGRALRSPDRLGSPQVDLSGGGPVVNPPTRAFGPSPTGPEPAQPPSVVRWPRALAAAACIAALCAFGVEVLRSSTTTPVKHRNTVAQIRLVEEEPAAESLERAGAQWNARTGVISRIVDGDAHHFAAGDPGDLAAVADWTCDGRETLGVFRPSTGTWFVFETWQDGSTAIPSSIEHGESLSIATDAAGCASPVVR